MCEEKLRSPGLLFRLVTLTGMLFVRKYRLIAGTGFVIVAIRVALRLVSLSRLLSWLTRKGAAECQNQTVMEDVAYYVERWLALAPYHPTVIVFLVH